VYRSNFSGECKLNQSKIELGQFERFAVRTIKADQKDDAITISTTRSSGNGEDVTTSETLSYDGKETETTVFGNSKRKATAKWSDDGTTLTINYTLLLDFNGQTSEIKGTETWTLSDDGKALTSQINSSSPQGEFSWKAVYDKQ
jgi:hypothetical protein